MLRAPAADRLHIGLFGRRNTGKSSLINALTGQALAVVSATAGTTTDPVRKAMEIHPIGPCLLIDTPGLDDAGALGRERVRQALAVLRKTDLALLVVDPSGPPGPMEMELALTLRAAGVPVLFIVNKSDLRPGAPVAAILEGDGWPAEAVSARTGEGLESLKQRIITLAPVEAFPPPLLRDLIGPGASVVLVVPVDAGMPRGRLILPEAQVLREVLDAHGTAHLVQPGELGPLLGRLITPPDLVVTDSQAFKAAAGAVPEAVPLTSFSILLARQRGNLERYVEGAAMIDRLNDGDRILVAEACTHHPQPSDIGRVKIPAWLREHTRRALVFDTTAGGTFPEDLTSYRLVVHCGGCMINRREVQARLARAEAQGIPMTNYGVLIARLHGVQERALRPLAGEIRVSSAIRP